MYIGNGKTEKFPLPSGYDGSVVILKMPNGKAIRMREGEAYTVKNGAVYFYAPVPLGIEVIFDEIETSDLFDEKSNNYVVIYADGSMQEVYEDPTLILEETRKLLMNAKKCAGEIEEAVAGAKVYVSSVLSSSGADLDGRVDGYSIRMEQLIENAAEKVQDDITEEWSGTLERLEVEKNVVKGYVHTVERIKDELNNLTGDITCNLKAELLSKCDDVLKGCEDLKILKSELQTVAADVKLEVAQIAQNYAEEMRLKVNEELELLRNLRSKMETDYENLNIRINNRWDLMRGDNNA